MMRITEREFERLSGEKRSKEDLSDQDEIE